jgi:hypothetical protein
LIVLLPSIFGGGATSRLAVLSLGLLIGAVPVARCGLAPEPPKVSKELFQQKLKAAKDTYEKTYKRFIEVCVTVHGPRGDRCTARSTA